MRVRVAAAAGLTAIVAVAVMVAVVPGADGEGRKRTSHRPAANAPSGWTWPPSDPMTRQGDECLIRLDERGVEFRRADREPRIATPVVVENMTFGGLELVSRFRKPPFVMDCHLALALARIGPELRQLGVTQLKFSSIHDVRTVRVNGGTKNTLSRHALGLAVDVFEVVTADGTVWVVDTDYTIGPNVLHAVEGVVNHSGWFRRLLTPGNDTQSHDDHFHFEAEVPALVLTKEERQAERAKKVRERKAERARRKAERKRRAKHARRKARRKRR